jgi:hypothetical protein
VTTPSSTIDTVGSTPGEVEIVPTPRMNSEESLFDALVRKFTVGMDCTMVDMLFRLASSSWAPVTTDTAIGVLCSGCTRLVAVTVTVCSLPSSAGLSAACWACAVAAQAAKARRCSRKAWRRRLGWKAFIGCLLGAFALLVGNC